MYVIRNFYCKWKTYTPRKWHREGKRLRNKWNLAIQIPVTLFLYTLKPKFSFKRLSLFTLSHQFSVAGAPGHPGPKGDAGGSISVPEVIVSPASPTVTQYQTATFYCSADGNPKPSVSWSKTSVTGQVNKDVQGNKLQIKSAGYNDSGSYVCTATNILGQAKKVVKLFVQGNQFNNCDMPFM